jgi:protein-tyrosine phosphatase
MIAPLISPTRTTSLKSDSTLTICAKVICNSRIIKHVAFATGVALAVSLLVTPPGWFVGGIGALAAVSFLFSLLTTACLEKIFAGKSNQVLSFEFAAMIREWKKFRGIRQYDEIPLSGKPGSQSKGKLFLGAIPTKDDAEKLTKDGALGSDGITKTKIDVFISINRPWETETRGFYVAPKGTELVGKESVPTKRIEAVKDGGVTFERVDVPDHTILDPRQLATAADMIQKHINAGKNVYIHCRAGVGRSAQAVRAYLVLHEEIAVEDAGKKIKDYRINSTIMKKDTRSLVLIKELRQLQTAKDLMNANLRTNEAW